MYLIFLILLSIAFIIGATTVLKLHPFLALLAAAFLFGACAVSCRPFFNQGATG